MIESRVVDGVALKETPSGRPEIRRVDESVLFGIGSSDLITLSSAAGLLLVVALGASWIAARRAAHVQPMDALRRE